jgi:hypothetical protein
LRKFCFSSRKRNRFGDALEGFYTDEINKKSTRDPFLRYNYRIGSGEYCLIIDDISST